jgi:site-specific recombinase XerD
MQANLGRAPNTVEAYGRALESYLSFVAQLGLDPAAVGPEQIALYVRDLTVPPTCSSDEKLSSHLLGKPLANATIQQRLTAVRLFYDFLLQAGSCSVNPVGRGRYVPSTGFGGAGQRGLVPRYHSLPWIPNDDQWRAILQAAQHEPLRNRVMLAFAYDAALRREELCLLDTSDIDPSHRLLRIRAETTKNHHQRVVPYSATTERLYLAYLRHRREISRQRGALFLSESRRNYAQPISIWTWSKVVQGIAERAGVPQFTTHTTRHLCLTDLARTGWDIHEIATFAGHRTIQSTLRYIHLSGRELAAKFERGMASIHSWRLSIIAEVLA